MLENIHLNIASGETVGIIGATGSAKSSLVQLIPRLYDVTAGSVTLGGIDVREYDLDTLRGAVAMVTIPILNREAPIAKEGRNRRQIKIRIMHHLLILLQNLPKKNLT